MTAKDLANQTNIPLWKVYYVARKLGRLPTVDELVNWKQQRGRPIKYKNDYSNDFYNMFGGNADKLLENLTIKKEN